ncbi:hypothetical protein N307_03423, partial [Dryobates pubescens]
AGSLPRSLVYDVCLATGTLSSDFHFLGPLLPCFPAGMPPGAAPQRSSVCSQEASNLGEGGHSAAQVGVRRRPRLCGVVRGQPVVGIKAWGSGVS